MERLIRATGTGVAIGWSKENWDAWERSVAPRDTDPAARVAGYRAMLGTLSSLFPGSVRVIERPN